MAQTFTVKRETNLRKLLIKLKKLDSTARNDCVQMCVECLVLEILELHSPHWNTENQDLVSTGEFFFIWYSHKGMGIASKCVCVCVCVSSRAVKNRIMFTAREGRLYYDNVHENLDIFNLKIVLLKQ